MRKADGSIPPSPLVARRYDDAGGRFDMIRDEEVRRQRPLRGDPVGLEVGDAFGRQERIVDQELPRKLLAGLAKMAVRGVRQNVGQRERRMISSPPSRLRIAAVAMVVRGHSALTAMPWSATRRASPSTTMLMPNFAMV